MNKTPIQPTHTQRPDQHTPSASGISLPFQAVLQIRRLWSIALRLQTLLLSAKRKHQTIGVSAKNAIPPGETFGVSPRPDKPPKPSRSVSTVDGHDEPRVRLSPRRWTIMIDYLDLDLDFICFSTHSRSADRHQ
jgi:hypothetical protein